MKTQYFHEIFVNISYFDTPAAQRLNLPFIILLDNTKVAIVNPSEGKLVNPNLVHCAIKPQLKIFNLISWVRLRGPVIQANGRLIFEDDMKSVNLQFNTVG